MKMLSGDTNVERHQDFGFPRLQFSTVLTEESVNARAWHSTLSSRGEL
jgi:hypothetical protein